MMNKSKESKVNLARTRSQSRLVLSAVFLIAAGVGLLGQMDMMHKSAYAQAVSPHPISNVIIQPSNTGVSSTTGVSSNCRAHPV
jgi:hypothetical protein